MFRIIIGALTIFGLFALFSGQVVGAAVGIGLIALAFLKFLFLFTLFGFFMRGFARRGRQDTEWSDRNWRAGRWHRRFGEQHSRDGSRGAQSGDRRESRERFEKWHDLAHAREEVDSWTEDL